MRKLFDLFFTTIQAGVEDMNSNRTPLENVGLTSQKIHLRTNMPTSKMEKVNHVYHWEAEREVPSSWEKKGGEKKRE